jgi:hypothetical protein
MTWNFKYSAKSISDAVNHVKFLRTEIGQRGDKWDFESSSNIVFVHIKDSTLASYYTLKFPNTSY